MLGAFNVYWNLKQICLTILTLKNAKGSDNTMRDWKILAFRIDQSSYLLRPPLCKAWNSQECSVLYQKKTLLGRRKNYNLI